MFYRKCEVKNLFACVFIYNQKGAMSDSIPYALLVYIGLIVFYLEAPVHVTYWFDRSLAMKSPSLNGMEFKHKIGSLCSVFHLYFRNMYSAWYDWINRSTQSFVWASKFSLMEENDHKHHCFRLFVSNKTSFFMAFLCYHFHAMASQYSRFVYTYNRYTHETSFMDAGCSINYP